MLRKLTKMDKHPTEIDEAGLILPTHTRAGVMLVHCLRRWFNITPAVGERLVFWADLCLYYEPV